jgi:hypothetical protein
MTLKNFWKILILSFYSSSLYIDIANKWRHWGLGFLIRMSILMASVSSLTLFFTISMFDLNNPSVSEILNQIPQMKIEKNSAHFIDTNIKSPLRIKSLDKEIIIVDLDIQSADLYKQNSIIFTSDRIAFNLAESSVFNVTYEDLNLNLINPEILVKLINEWKKTILGSLLLLGITLGSLICFMLTLLKSLFYASISNVVMRIINGNLDFKQLTRLAIIAQAPSLIASTISSVLFFNLISNSIIQSIISSIYIFYFIFAVSICNKALSKNK